MPRCLLCFCVASLIPFSEVWIWPHPCCINQWSESKLLAVNCKLSLLCPSLTKLTMNNQGAVILWKILIPCFCFTATDLCHFGACLNGGTCTKEWEQVPSQLQRRVATCHCVPWCAGRRCERCEQRSCEWDLIHLCETFIGQHLMHQKKK